MPPTATTVGATLLLSAIVALAGCTPTPAGRTAGVPATAPATPTTAPTLPPGTTLVDIPEAGVSLAIPAGWHHVTGSELADSSRRADLAATYPGAGSLLAIADEMGDRAAPAFIAVDPSAATTGGALAPNIAVLVSQPSVSGLLLSVVAGFVDSGFRDAFDAPAPTRDRVETPMGDAIRLRYDVSAGAATPLEADVWLIGAPAATVVVSVMGPTDVIAALDPDALIAASRVLP